VVSPWRLQGEVPHPPAHRAHCVCARRENAEVRCSDHRFADRGRPRTCRRGDRPGREVRFMSRPPTTAASESGIRRSPQRAALRPPTDDLTTIEVGRRHHMDPGRWFNGGCAAASQTRLAGRRPMDGTTRGTGCLIASPSTVATRDPSDPLLPSRPRSDAKSASTASWPSTAMRGASVRTPTWSSRETTSCNWLRFALFHLMASVADTGGAVGARA